MSYDSEFETLNEDLGVPGDPGMMHMVIGWTNQDCLYYIDILTNYYYVTVGKHISCLCLDQLLRLPK